MRSLVPRDMAVRSGLPPGTLLPPETEDHSDYTLTFMRYDANNLHEEQVDDLSCLETRLPDQVHWLHVNGLGNVEVLETLAQALDLHPLAIEDIQNTGQRAKVDDFYPWVLLVLSRLGHAEGTEPHSDHMSLLLGDDLIVSFQTLGDDPFEPVRKRLHSSQGRIRHMGVDYLFYALLDAVVDGYFSVLEGLGERVEGLEDEVMQSTRPEMLQEVHRAKSDVLLVRRAAWPLREAVSTLTRGAYAQVSEPVQVYLRDVYDHTFQILDTAESMRDMLSSLLDIYLSSVSNRMNEVMKVLTVFSTLFIPITFVTSLYGMNFEFMPELHWPWGYVGVWGLIIVIVIAMVIFLKRRRWF